MRALGPSLLDRFTSREGYRAFDDVVPAREWSSSIVDRASLTPLRSSVQALQEMGVKTGVVSNADSRIRASAAGSAACYHAEAHLQLRPSLL